MDFDSLFDEGVCLIGRGLAIDAALFRFLVVNLARFLGELVAHIFGILLDALAQLAHHRHEHRLARIDRACENRLLGLALAVGLGGEARRHQLLFDLSRTAKRTTHQAGLGLLVIGRGIAEPAVEFVPVSANEFVMDHVS